jgi:hypothetical protein
LDIDNGDCCASASAAVDADVAAVLEKSKVQLPDWNNPS